MGVFVAPLAFMYSLTSAIPPTWIQGQVGSLVASGLLSTLACGACLRLIPALIPNFIAKGRTGRDLLKPNEPVIPESMGVVVGIVYVICFLLFIPVLFTPQLFPSPADASLPPSYLSFPHDKFAGLLGGILAIQSMLFLGFADDVLDIKWRVKIWLPVFASLPLVIVYSLSYGRTDILVPLPLRVVLGTRLLHLGWLYYIYLMAVAVFSTNAINILAGANGLEAGQSLVIATSLAVNNVLQVQFNPSNAAAHLMSLYFLIPFIGVTIALLRFNRYPARVFGGDTYCYFAGMVFAASAILGNTSKTLLLFMVPQIFNFVLSVPQLFKLVDCPRHRMPILDTKTGNIEASTFPLSPKTSRLSLWIIYLFESLGLIRVTRTPKTRTPKNCTNFTLLSTVLVCGGPVPEYHAVLRVLIVQLVCSLLAFVVRYGLVNVVYND